MKACSAHNLLPLLLVFCQKLILCLQRELKASPTSSPGRERNDAFCPWGRSVVVVKVFQWRDQLCFLPGVFSPDSPLLLSCQGFIYSLCCFSIKTVPRWLVRQGGAGERVSPPSFLKPRGPRQAQEGWPWKELSPGLIKTRFPSRFSENWQFLVFLSQRMKRDQWTNLLEGTIC